MPAELPDTFKARDGTWYGFACGPAPPVNTPLVAEADRPRGIRDLVDPRLKGKIALAKPLFGTTATHAACLFAAGARSGHEPYFIRSQGQWRAGLVGEQAGRSGCRFRPGRRGPDRYG